MKWKGAIWVAVLWGFLAVGQPQAQTPTNEAELWRLTNAGQHVELVRNSLKQIVANQDFTLEEVMCAKYMANDAKTLVWLVSKITDAELAGETDLASVLIKGVVWCAKTIPHQTVL